ncbi:MAG: hypothetical protein L6407_02605, partial [Candidatus Delongbacteria bacterium]|nr:hypothetical protein [Candidatus Delongbacteria bacterium]
ALDKKINFENIYNETAYFDCRICGKEEQKIVCDKCGQTNQFSLNYDALSCRCSNDVKVKTCDCGTKHGHSDFYLISDGIKWQYSKSKSYYNYRKGRMLAFSTCPTCGVFSVEKCKVCGSKVNFGAPNKNNEVYCKNCGSVNQFLCENRKCNDSVKVLKNPNSIEQKLDWLNEVMSFKTRITSERVKYSEPGNVKKEKAKISSGGEISIGGDSTPDFTNSFIEEFDNKTKEIITSSFINEIENEVNQRKQLQEELRNYNKKQASGSSGAKPSFGSPAGAKPIVPDSMTEDMEEEDSSSEHNEIAFDDSGKGLTFYIIIAVVAVAVLAGAWWGYFAFVKAGDKDDMKKVETITPVVPTTEAPPTNTVPAEKQEPNAAQSYMDAQKQNIQKAKDAVEKNQKAQEEQLKEIK